MKTLSVAQTLLKNRFTNAPEKKVGNSERVYFPERNTMKYELQELLGLEQNNWKKNYLSWKEEQYTPEEIEQKKELLQLFKEVFDWNTTYELQVSYYTEPSQYLHKHECKNAEELRNYLNYEVEFPEPDYDDINYDYFDYNSDIQGEESRTFRITISDLRLKEALVEANK